MKTATVSYPKAQALAIATLLIEESRWFQSEPLPYDVYAITVKAERELPEAMGISGAGKPVAFQAWIESVEREFECLDDEVKAEFHDYFLRGLTPAEAIAKEREDAEV